MTTLQIDQVVETMQVLADPMRLRILFVLSEQSSLSLSALHQRLPISFSALSSHVNELKKQDLVHSRQRDNELYYSLANKAVLRLTRLF
ncbi:helix-turn-helix transcriptional regulator [Spirosoma sp. KNUC1025]|uniref:ArsR/SmtB family transcription factor n=1 Tax=Spirosoma sp. KNUC1025 TaxID=2894082 RepID=UPI00386ED89C|nr:metalloregulator ArsR/SmtB family transcription factor [Spirosoma sp. KNUC1025]